MGEAFDQFKATFTVCTYARGGAGVSLRIETDASAVADRYPSSISLVVTGDAEEAREYLRHIQRRLADVLPALVDELRTRKDQVG